MPTIKEIKAAIRAHNAEQCLKVTGSKKTLLGLVAKHNLPVSHGPKMMKRKPIRKKKKSATPSILDKKGRAKAKVRGFIANKAAAEAKQSADAAIKKAQMLVKKAKKNAAAMKKLN